MAEANASPGLPACDLCHSRKVRCNRQDPCQNCVIARADCQRTRLRRAPKSRIGTDEKIQGLLARLHSLEGSLATPAQEASPIASQQTGPARSSYTPPAASLQHTISSRQKRKRDNEPTEEPQLSTPRSEDSTSLTEDARAFFQRELVHQDSTLSNSRRAVLQTTINFINQISHPGHLMTAPNDRQRDYQSEDTDSTEPIEPPSAETLFWLINSSYTDSARIQGHHYPDHMPLPALERMCFALLDGTATGQTLVHYSISVYHKATLALVMNSSVGQPQSLAPHAVRIRDRYTRAILHFLGLISPLTPPSLSLLQALLSAANIMQVMGDIPKCWSLLASACHTLVALGYHRIQHASPQTDADKEIYACITWAYQMDKTLAMVLLRPQCLPKLPFRASSLFYTDAVPELAEYAKLVILLAEVQEEVLDLTSGPGTKDEREVDQGITAARQKLTGYISQVEQRSKQPVPRGQSFVIANWLPLVFDFNSILVTIIRMSPNISNDPILRAECLSAARDALESLRTLHRGLIEHGHHANAFQFYTGWTLFTYPLTPIYVVFCSIVSTSNASDFQLIEDITESLSSLAEINQPIAKIYKFCSILTSLCRPLVKHPAPMGNNESGAGLDASTSLPSPHSSRTAPASNEPYGASQPTSAQTSPAGNISSCPPPPITTTATLSPWLQGAFVPGTQAYATGPSASASMIPTSYASVTDEDLMWQLFGTQPTLDWFDADILNDLMQQDIL